MNRLAFLLSRFGPCALCGSIAGAGTGLVFGLTESAIPAGSGPLPLRSVVAVGLLLGLLAYLGILLFIGILGNYGVRALLFPALGTCLLTALVTVLVVNRLDAGYFGALLGWLLGLMVGRLLCHACAAKTHAGVAS